MEPRTAHVERETKETRVTLTLNLDGEGKLQGEVQPGFFQHMLETLALNAKVDLTVSANGDLKVDAHHLVEDVGICLGQAVAQAAGDKKGIARYGWALVPFDEALVLAAADFSGRGYLSFSVPFAGSQVGDFDTELVPEFFRALTQNAGLTLHLRALAGKNTHHLMEACFKACGRALAQALQREGENIPSVKGVL